MSVHLKTLLALCRVSNLPTVWMNVIASVAITSSALGLTFPLGITLLLVLALSCFYAAGMSFNDYCDRHWDAERQPFRPIPAGKLSARQALMISIGLFLLGFILLAFAPHPLGLIAGIGLVALILAYDFFHKRHPASVFLMAGTRLGVYLVAATAISGSIALGILLLGLIQGAYTLLVTIVARAENHLPKGYGFPIIPWMIAAMGLVDGIALAILISPYWLFAGVATLLLTRWGQKYIRGD
ncbi:MAG TPA: UbiA family prenyltransferase [Cellvibrionaceae bacterium]